MSLNEELNLLYEKVLGSMHPDIRQRLTIENEKLFSSFLEGKALKKGSLAPDVSFRDEKLALVQLRNL